MPRKSQAALSVVAPLPGERRPEPPEELNPAEASEWREVVSRLPADWFPRESRQILVQYCRHVVRARVIAMLIDEIESDVLRTVPGVRLYKILLGMARAESDVISNLATKMRITQQSRWQPKTAFSRTANSSESAREKWAGVA
jgi:hypothetical protein